MRTATLTLAGLVLFTGCQHLMLEKRTLDQASTLTDIQYTQVLNNLAMFSVNPDALPYFSITASGQNNNQQTGDFAPSFGWDLLLNATTFRFDKIAAGFRASRTSVQTWSTTSVLNPDELALMRCVYQKTLGYSDDGCDKRLEAYFAARRELLSAMQPGWYCIGTEHDVPRCAAYVGCYCGTYVWVQPGGENNLTLLTLAILDLANAVPSGSTHISTDQTDAKIKKYSEQAQAIATILEKLENDSSSQVDALRSNLDDHVLDKLNEALAQKAEDRKAWAAAEPGAPAAPGAPGTPRPSRAAADVEAPLIRQRPNVIAPFSAPIVIPNPQ